MQGLSVEQAKKLAESNLKALLSGLAAHMFGDVEMRYDAFFLVIFSPSSIQGKK
jgi:hypothetical protein